MNDDFASGRVGTSNAAFKKIMLVLIVLLLIVVVVKARSKKKDIAPKPDDKKPDGKAPVAESGYVLTGLRCACKDEYGNVYRGDQLLLGDGSKVCLCPDYFAVYGYPYWWGGYYGWRFPGRRWHGGHRGGHHGGHGGHRMGGAPMGGAPTGGGMRGGAPTRGGAPLRGGAPMGGGGGHRMGGAPMGGAPMGGGMRGGRR